MKPQGVVVSVLSMALVFSSATSVGLDDEFLEEAVSVIEECGDKSFTICAKERALKYMEQLPSILNFGGGLSMVPTDGVKRSSRYFNPMSLPSDPEAREEALDAVLMERIVSYLSSHTLQFKLPEETLETLRRSLEDDMNVEEEVVEGRRKKKRRKGMNMMVLIQLKAAAIGAIMLKLIGIVAIKALMMAKAALIIASILALKKAVDKKQHSSTYEIIAAHPYDDHGHYDRSFQPFDLAYNAYAGQNMNYK